MPLVSMKRCVTSMGPPSAPRNMRCFPGAPRRGDLNPVALRADFCYGPGLTPGPADRAHGQEKAMSDHANDSKRLPTVDRRTFLKRVGAAGAGAVIASRLPAPDPASAQDATVKADPSARRGGTLRFCVHTAPAHFDVHQSGTVANIGAQSPMYDYLIRRDPRDGQTIIPDLAQRWEIAPDGRKYTFHLRRGVKFHDGAEFTAEDVKATYERIIAPPKGVVIPRTPLFSAVSDVVVLDPYRIEFRLKEARPRTFVLGAFASGWNIIVRKKTLEENAGNLRNVWPIRAPGSSGTSRGGTRKSGSWSGTPTTGTRGCPTSTSSRSITCRRSRPSSARPSSRASSTTDDCSTRSAGEGARRRRG